MVFFAVTPKDVVQFIAYQSARLKEARTKAEAGETEYDTQLFAGGPEEEPIENLTGRFARRAARRPAPSPGF